MFGIFGKREAIASKVEAETSLQITLDSFTRSLSNAIDSIPVNGRGYFFRKLSLTTESGRFVVDCEDITSPLDNIHFRVTDTQTLAVMSASIVRNAVNGPTHWAVTRIGCYSDQKVENKFKDRLYIPLAIFDVHSSSAKIVDISEGADKVMTIATHFGNWIANDLMSYVDDFLRLRQNAVLATLAKIGDCQHPSI